MHPKGGLILSPSLYAIDTCRPHMPTELSCTVAGCMAVVSLEQSQQSRWLLEAERPSSAPRIYKEMRNVAHEA